MVGRNRGHITQQGQVLSDFFDQAGYPVISVSKYLNRYRRLLDIIVTLIQKRHETDIVILEVYSGRSFVLEDISSWLAARLGLRLVMWLHGGSLPDFVGRFPRWSQRVLNRADVIITPSEFLSRAVGECGFHARIIPNVIDLPAYPYRHRSAVAPRLFWMRSFHWVWNPEMAVRVLARLIKRIPDANLIMGGPDKGSLKEVKKLVASLQLSDRVSFPGFLDTKAKHQVGHATDIFINTNRIDNAPVAVIEACAMGLPVITTRVGGIPDLLKDRETAIFVADNDDEAMAGAIEELVRHPQTAALLSENGKELAGRFSWESVRPQWEQVFAELIASKPKAVRDESLTHHESTSHGELHSVGKI